jgi:hypothetical protein
MAVVEQAVAMLGIDRATFRLTIGAVRTADIGAFIPAEAEPAQRIEDFFLGFAGRAHLIGILDTEQELPAMFPGEAIVDKGNIGSADMRIAGGRGSYTGADGLGDFSHGARPTKLKRHCHLCAARAYLG